MSEQMKNLPTTPNLGDLVVRDNQPSANQAVKWKSGAPMWSGLIALILLVFGVGYWGATTKISGAVVASGMIQVESLRQVVQHPEGGVVGDILVTEGDTVEAGQVVLRFDDALLQSELTIVDGQLNEIQARKSRLKAERDNAETIEFETDLLDRAKTSSDIQELVDGQKNLFHARRDSAKKEIEQLNERKTQISLQIDGNTAQLESLDIQLELVAQELTDQQTLLSKGLAQASRVLALMREEARLKGQVGELKSVAARGAAQIVETDLEILKLTSQRREAALDELRQIEYTSIELTERSLSARETLSRLEVRAPASGIVFGLTVFAVRSVVRPADPILYVIPQDQPMVIASRIEAIHVDQVRQGQEATLRFSTFDQRTTPEVFGYVTRVSADIFNDDVTGLSYYAAEILPKPGEIERLGGVELLPGMPVEAFIKTDERTPISFLVKPLMDYFNRSFREG
jgi:HlyD family secretion protein